MFPWCVHFALFHVVGSIHFAFKSLNAASIPVCLCCDHFVPELLCLCNKYRLLSSKRGARYWTVEVTSPALPREPSLWSGVWREQSSPERLQYSMWVVVFATLSSISVKTLFLESVLALYSGVECHAYVISFLPPYSRAPRFKSGPRDCLDDNFDGFLQFLQADAEIVHTIIRC
jgi:hypothetical protein